MTFKNYRQFADLKEPYKEAMKTASHPHEIQWLTFMGGNDTGKTHLAVAICKAWANQGVPAKYAYVPLLLDELKEGFRNTDGEKAERYSERFKRFCNVPLLVLDDLGAEYSTAWVREKLETIIDYRYMNNLSLVVTTNKNLEELPSRISSRLVRHPKAVVIALNSITYTERRYNEKH